VGPIQTVSVCLHYLPLHHKSTFRNDLTEMLSQAGVKVVSCRRLTQKPDAKNQWSTAAFFVSCKVSCQDVFYNEATWQEGAELRDWYFKNGAQ